MKHGVFTILGLLAFLVINAQGEMNNLALEPNLMFCKPGVTNKSPGKGLTIDYTYNPEFKMRPTNAETPSEVEANKRFLSKIKIPLLYKGRAKLMLGFKYAFEKYSFEEIDPENYSLFKHINEKKLKDAESAAYLIVPINHKFYTSFRFSVAYRGDYDGFLSTNSDFATYRAAGVLGIKKHKDLEYGVGIYYSKNIRRAIAYPFGFVNWTINDRWGLESAIPVSTKLRHNLKDGNLVLFGLDYSAQSYGLHVNDIASLSPSNENILYHYRRSSIETSVSYMRNLTSWTWVQFKLGYSINVNSQAREIHEQITYDLRPSGSIVGTVSFFLSPPKKYLNK